MNTPTLSIPEMVFKSFNTVFDVVTHTKFNDEELWLPYIPGSSFRPTMLNISAGSYCSFLKTEPGQILGRHYHTAPVHSYTVQGAWRYLEYDWVARAGSFVYEPPGIAHTLFVEEGDEPMITFFMIQGGLIYVDDNGKQIGYEDVYTTIELCRNYYRKMGLDEAALDAIIR